MKVIYISALSSQRLINAIYESTGRNPGFAVQKFSRLLVKGLVGNGIDCSTLSNAPITDSFSESRIISLKDETEGDIRYRYIPYINLPFLKHLCVLFYTLFYIIRWGLKGKEDKVVICDVLCISASLGALLATKLCRIKSVAVVTDIYDQMVGKIPHGIKGIKSKLAGALNRWYVTSFSSYVLLTEAMNTVVNPKDRPYIVMEALCDIEAFEEISDMIPKDYPKVVMYAGGLEERYGLKMLVEAFKSLVNRDWELHLYGSGSYVNELRKDIEDISYIKYFGVKSNEEIMRAEKRASLLVNPRFTTEEFAKFSFPSKNMEYMVSGTPVLTTRLPGMPFEYHEYVFLFAEESVEGYAKVLEHIQDMEERVLTDKGISAKEYVIRSKNYLLQARRIVDMISN